MTKTLTKATELDELREYAREATKAITGLTAGGSEYFGKRIGDIYTADLPFCVGRIRERFEREAEWTRKSIAARQAAEVKLPELLAALKSVNRIIADGAMTGFNWKEGDWADRLFESQQATSRALALAEGRASLTERASP